jgi:hypothetical protein
VTDEEVQVRGGREGGGGGGGGGLTKGQGGRSSGGYLHLLGGGESMLAYACHCDSVTVTAACTASF